MRRNFGLVPRDARDNDANDIFSRFCIAGLLTGIAIALGLLISIVWLAGMLIALPAHAHDPGGYWAREIAEGRAPPKEWWNGLASGKGLCCSFADGVRVEDVDWDTGGPNGAYRVRLGGTMVDVPESAVVTEPNRYGPAVVWPYQGNEGETLIRCFLPGAGA